MIIGKYYTEHKITSRPHSTHFYPTVRNRRSTALISHGNRQDNSRRICRCHLNDSANLPNIGKSENSILVGRFSRFLPHNPFGTILKWCLQNWRIFGPSPGIRPHSRVERVLPAYSSIPNNKKICILSHFLVEQIVISYPASDKIVMNANGLRTSPRSMVRMPYE